MVGHLLATQEVTQSNPFGFRILSQWIHWIISVAEFNFNIKHFWNVHWFTLGLEYLESYVLDVYEVFIYHCHIFLPNWSGRLWQVVGKDKLSSLCSVALWLSKWWQRALRLYEIRFLNDAFNVFIFSFHLMIFQETKIWVKVGQRSQSGVSKQVKFVSLISGSKCLCIVRSAKKKGTRN